MDPYAIDIARHRLAERLELAREERLARAASMAGPGAFGRVALGIADLLVSAGESLRSRYLPGGSGGWA